MLTVLFATRNRSWLLRDVLEAYCHLREPSGGWKLVVVDNGSTDETPQTINSFSNRLPLHLVYQPTLGKNNALNTGLSLMEGDLTVLTDDDVFPDSDWLVQLRNAADAQPTYLVFGGSIVPCWEVPPPPWIQWIDLGPIFTISSPSLKSGPLPLGLLSRVYGPNMAIRTEIFRSGISFDPSIGPRGSSYPMGSETELVLRLGRQGYKAWFVSSAVVEHFIRKEQLNQTWILQRAIRFGRGCQRMYPNVRLWWGVPRHLFRDLPKELLIMATAWIFFRRAALLRCRWRFNVLRGKAIEALAMESERRKRTVSL